MELSSLCLNQVARLIRFANDLVSALRVSAFYLGLDKCLPRSRAYCNNIVFSNNSFVLLLQFTFYDLLHRWLLESRGRPRQLSLTSPCMSFMGCSELVTDSPFMCLVVVFTPLEYLTIISCTGVGVLRRSSELRGFVRYGWMLYTEESHEASISSKNGSAFLHKDY